MRTEKRTGKRTEGRTAGRSRRSGGFARKALKAALQAVLMAGCLGALPALTGCMDGPTGQDPVAQGGGGSEAVALTAGFANPDGTPAAGIRVRLRPARFLADTLAASQGGGSEVIGLAGTIRDAFTDANGMVHLDSVPRGEYLLEANDSAGHALLLPAMVTGDRDSFFLPAAKLQPTGAVTGSFVSPEGFTGSTWVQIYGLDRVAKADSATGKFRMDGLPGGTYTLRAVHSAPAVDPREIDSVAAVPDTTVDIGAIRLASFENENYAAWPHSRRLYLNTSASGAGVAGNVDDFPVLVRLTAADFDFSQSPGRDIRFSDMKGKRLRFEVERWDSAAALAEIWVRVDRVLGNSSTQFITMHWGLAGAESFSDGRPVFAADAGFTGAWHLAESAPDTLADDYYQDASGYDPASDRTAAEDRAGTIGNGAAFGGTDYIVVPVADPLLQPNSAVTASAWMRSARTDALGGTLLSMGETYALRVNPNGSLRFQIFTGETFAVESPKGVNLLDSAWHHVAGSYDGANLALYVDGKPVAKTQAHGFLDYRFWPGFALGRHGNRKAGYGFIGNLDQVEIGGERARSADWIRLAYENQREGAVLVEFR
jgi:hypothetical protein